MAATALLKFRDALNTGANGQAFLSEFGQNVVIENSDNTDVLSWRIWLVYAPPGTAREILPGTQPYTLLASNPASSTPTYTLMNLQDGFPGCYRIMLEVFSASNYGGVLDVDIRNIAVLTPQLNYVIPPYQLVPPSLPVPGSGAPTSKPNELNFGGQPYGWAGGANPAIKMQDEALRDLEGLIRVPPMEGVAESALAMDAVADGYFANAFGFDGTYTWVGFREHNEHVGKWVRFSKALNYVERHEYTAGTNSVVATLVLDADRSRMLEVLVYDSGGGSYVAEIITHTLATPSVAGTPVSLGAASGGSQSITVLPAGDYIFVFGLPGGTKRLLATDLTVQVFSAIGGIPHRMFYDPTDRYGDGEGRVYTQPAYYVYLRWVPSTGANDAFFQPEGEYNLGVVIGIDPVGGRMWAVWEKGTSRNHLGSWDLHPFGNNLRFIAPAGEIGEPDLPHDSMFGGIVDGTAAYSIAQQSAPSYCYYVQKFTDSGAAIVEGAQVSDGATSLDAYDPQYLFLNVFNAFGVSLKAGSKMLTLVQSYSSRDWCVRALELSPMADDLEDFEATEIGWAPVARVGGDLSGHGDNPKVTGIGGRNLNAISGAVPGEQLLMPPNSGQSMVFSFTPYTTRVGAHANPTEAVGHPFTGFDVYRTNDDDPLTLQVNETAYLHPRTLHLRDVKGNAGHLGSHVTVEPYGTEEIKFGDMGFVSSFLLRSAYEEVVLSSVPGAAPFTGAWQVAERHRLWEGIDVDANLTVKSGYALCKVDSSGGVITVTLIASPQHDDYCIVKDVTGDAITNNITVDGNSETIDGQATKTIAVAYGYLKLRYDGVSGEWQIVSERATTGVASDELVKVSATDTGAGYLEGKIAPGFGLSTEVLTPAGVESLEVGLEATSGDAKWLTTASLLGSMHLAWDGTHLWGIPKYTAGGTGYLRFSPTDGSFLEEVTGYPDGYFTENLVYEATLDRVVAVRLNASTDVRYLEAFSQAVPSVKTTGTSIAGIFTLVKMIAGGGYVWLHLDDGDDGFIYRVPADLSTSVVAVTAVSNFDLLLFDNDTTRYGDGEGRLFYSVSDDTIGRLKPSTLATDATFSPISGEGEILCMYVNETTGRIWCAWVDDGDYYVGAFDCNTLGANLRSAVAVSNTMFDFTLTTYYGVVALCAGMPTQVVQLTDTGAVITQYTLGYAYCETVVPAPGLLRTIDLAGHLVFPTYDYSTSRVHVKCFRGITEDHSPVEVAWEERQDQLVKVDQYDGIGGFLVDKLAAGSVSFTTIIPDNGMRQLQFNLNQTLAGLDPLAAGDNDDVAPTDWDLAFGVRATSVAAAGITGFAAITGSGKILFKKLYNVGSYSITLKHQNAGSIAANRLIIPGGADLVMSPDDVVDLFYDVTSQRWRIG